MSTTPASISVPSDDVGRSPTSVVTAVTTFGGTVVLATGALLAGAGMALHIGAMPDDVGIAIAIAEDPAWLTSHLLLGVGFPLVAAGALMALARVRAGRGAGATTVGIVLTAIGALVMGLSDMAHGALGFALADQVDPATSYDIHRAYFETPAILGLNTGPMVLTLGMLVLGFGILRSRALPRWVGTVIMLTPVAVHASFAFELPTFTQGLAFALGIGAFAYATLRGPSLFARRRGVAGV